MESKIDVHAFLKIVSNEKCSPTLLPYYKNFIDELESVLQEKEEEIQTSKRQVPYNSIEIKFLEAQELELLRWKYFLRCYHEARMKKIQMILGKMQRPNDEYMSLAERRYCDTIIPSMAAAFGSEFSPESFKPAPDDLSSFVFFEALDNIGDTLLSDSTTNQPLNITTGTFYFSRFQHVQPFVEEGKVMLV